MKLFKHTTSALALALVGLISCQALDQSGSTSTPATSTTTSKAATTQQSTKTKTATKPLLATARTTEASAPRSGMLASSQAFPTGDPKTSALLVEKFVPREVQVGQSFEYETRVTNLTNLPLESVLIVETMDSNFSLSSASPKPAISAGTGQWMVGDLGPNESRSIVVTGSAKSPKAIQSCITAEYASSLCSTIDVVQPALQLVAAGPEEVLTCDEIIYSYNVKNTGSGMARDVVVKGQLPKGMKAGGSSTFSKRIGDLAAGKSSKFELRVTTDARGAFRHEAVAEAQGNLTAKSQSVSTIVRQPKLEISAVGTKQLFAGRVAKFDVTVKNVGDGIARETILEGTVPSGSDLVSASDKAKQNGSKLLWSLGSLAPNQSRTVSMHVKPRAIGRLASIMKAKSVCAPEVATPLQTEVKGIPAILLEVVDLEDPIEVGQNETYVITVTNQGTAPATGVKIAVTLPDSTSFVSTSGTTPAIGTSATTRRFEFAPLATLAPKAKASWRIVLKGTRAADARFRVAMNSDQLTSPVDETEATNFYE